jgi:NSS family neurotransmitter:Na+ symporter
MTEEFCDLKLREQWGTRIGFILAAVGSAVGLGNIWRFPYMAYENGGGAFFIPYLFAMLTAGIPLMILEFGLGHRFRGSAPKTLASASGRWEWLGWWQVLVAFVISVYYVVVIGWTLSYAGFGVTQAWGADPESFFFGQYLGLTGGPLEFGGIQGNILGVVLLAWAITWFVVFRGVEAGIERAGKILMPVLFLLVLLLIGRVIFLPGAAEGLNYLFKPDFSKIWNYKVWADAYGQIFFTLSVGFAIMIAYSSYLPKKSDINNNAFITVFLNCGFSMLAGILVFSVLGYMALEQNAEVSKVVSSGVGLAFVTIPKAINLLPWPAFFGTLFFVALAMAGVSSHISITEACVSGLMDKFGWTRKKAASLFCGVGLVLSVVFTFGSGLFILDIVDHFINNFGILTCALAEIVLMAWVVKLPSMRSHVNSVSDFAVGGWWNFCLRFVSTALLGVIIIRNLIGDLQQTYGGYDLDMIVMFGWCVLLATLLGAIALHKIGGPCEIEA